MQKRRSLQASDCNITLRKQADYADTLNRTTLSIAKHLGSRSCHLLRSHCKASAITHCRFHSSHSLSGRADTCQRSVVITLNEASNRCSCNCRCSKSLRGFACAVCCSRGLLDSLLPLDCRCFGTAAFLVKAQLRCNSSSEVSALCQQQQQTKQ